MSVQLFLCVQVKMWITFMIPKIEDGNNFGVSIQVRQFSLRKLASQKKSSI